MTTFPSKPEPPWLESLYEKLADDDEGRVCKGISEEACRVTPGNFLKTLCANALTSMGDRLASAKTTLPWLLSYIGAPAWCLGLLVPIRESGSMLPQMWLGGWVRQRPLRKGVWVGGSLVQGISLLLIGWSGAVLEGLAGGLAILLLLALFSLGRAACSLAYKDVLGKTIPKTRRGRLSGWISAVAGLGALGVGAGLGFLPEPESGWWYAGLLGGAALLWFAAAVIYARIKEFPGETSGGADGLHEALAKWRLLRDDRPFRRFVIGRALAMGSGLAAPFYVALAMDDLGRGSFYLGLFIAAEGMAGLITAPLWGRWADRSSRLVFSSACGMAAILTLAVVAWSWLNPFSDASAWFYPLVMFGLGAAHAGVRLGRKTYLVDMAEGNRRTDYVAVSNTVMGALLLCSGIIGVLASLISPQAALLVLAVTGLIGSALSLRWKEVSSG